MALNNHVENFTLDMAPGGIAPVLNVSQGDTGRAYTADMYWGGASYDVSGLTVRLRGRKRDNTVFDYALPAPSGTKVSFDLEDKEQVTIIPGNVECELVFTDSDSRVVGTANFVIIVEEVPYDPDAPSQSVVPGIEDLIEEVLGGEVAPAVDEWLDAHPEATTTVQDGAVTWNKLNTDVQDKINAGTVKLDEFPGSTVEEKIKYVLENYTDAVVELGDIEINNTIQIEVSKDVRHVKFVDGKITLNADFLSCITYCPQFSNVDFVGNNHKVFVGGYVGAAFYNCNFINTSLFDLGNSGASYLQSLYISNCDVNKQTNVFVRAPRCFDLKVVNSRFESSQNTAIDIHGGSAFEVNQCSIDNCLFEGFTTNPPLKFGTAFMVTVSNCYFEASNNASVEFTSSNIRAIISGNIFSAPSATAPHVKGVTGVMNAVTFIKNRWSGSQHLTNLFQTWDNNIGNENYTNSSIMVSGSSVSSYKKPNYTKYTFDSDTHELTITYKVPGEYYSSLRALRVYIRGRYSSNSALYAGYIDADVYTFTRIIDGAQRAGVKVNIVDSMVTGSGGTGTLTAELDNDSAGHAYTIITLKTSNFVSIDAVQIVDRHALGSFVYDF